MSTSKPQIEVYPAYVWLQAAHESWHPIRAVRISSNHTFIGLYLTDGRQLTNSGETRPVQVCPTAKTVQMNRWTDRHGQAYYALSTIGA